MRMRFMATTVLGVALLFSQVGNFLVAALCPHLQSGAGSCQTQVAEPAMSHEDMGHTGHMEMKHETVPTLDPDADAVAMGQLHGPCLHCSVHSSRTPTSASLKKTEPAKHSIDPTMPLQLSRVVPPTLNPVAVLTSRAHGPPGEATPRHILISIFRI